MPPRKKQLVAAVNVVGPDGSLCETDNPIPDAWLEDPTFDAEQLEASGGATRQKG